MSESSSDDSYTFSAPRRRQYRDPSSGSESDEVNDSDGMGSADGGSDASEAAADARTVQRRALPIRRGGRASVAGNGPVFLGIPRPEVVIGSVPGRASRTARRPRDVSADSSTSVEPIAASGPSRARSSQEPHTRRGTASRRNQLEVLIGGGVSAGPGEHGQPSIRRFVAGEEEEAAATREVARRGALAELHQARRRPAQRQRATEDRPQVMPAAGPSGRLGEGYLDSDPSGDDLFAGSPPSNPRRVRRRPSSDDDEPTISRTIRRRLNGNSGSASASSSRANSASRPNGAPVPPSRPLGQMRRGTVVDLTADSDEDEVVLLAQPPGPGTAVRRQRAAFVGGAGGGQGGEEAQRRQRMQQDLQDIEAALARRREEALTIIRQERLQRQQRDPSPPANPVGPPQRIGLGGAVVQRGGQQIRYRALGADFQPGAPIDIERRLARVPRAEPERPPPQPAAHDPAPLAWPAFIARGLGLGQGNGRWAMADRLNDPGFMQQLWEMGRGGVPQAAARPLPPDVPAIIAAVEHPTHPQPLPGFTDNFDLSSVQPIIINDHGDVVKPKKKPGLVCFICHARLRMSGSYRNEDDRVWSLRCGHMLDQRCLVKIATPTSLKELDSVQPPINVLPVLGSTEKKGKRKAKPKVQKEVPREYEWKCPARGCGKAHKSAKMPGAEEWAQVAGSGAVPVFM